jgi:hypothetical protein
MINPLILKDFIAALIITKTYSLPYLDSSMALEESLITSGSILLSYVGSDYQYSDNFMNLPTKVLVKPRFKVSIVYQCLTQTNESLVIFNDIVTVINGTSISETLQKPFRIIKDELKQYEGSKKLYGVFEHEIIFETNYSFSQILNETLVIPSLLIPLADGSIKLENGHFYGYDGTNWLQLDNSLI